MGSARIDGGRPGIICSVNRSPCSAHLAGNLRESDVICIVTYTSPLKIDDAAAAWQPF